MDDPELHLIAGEPAQRFGQGLHRALDIGLQHDPELLPVTSLDLIVKILQRNLAGLDEFGLALFGAPMLCDLPRRGLIGHRNEGVTSLGHPLQPQNFYRERGYGLVDLPAPVVDHGPDPTVENTANA